MVATEDKENMDDGWMDGSSRGEFLCSHMHSPIIQTSEALLAFAVIRLRGGSSRGGLLHSYIHLSVIQTSEAPLALLSLG
jgi:hypothetical protein